MSKWYVAAKKADFNQIAQECGGIDPVIARLMVNRNVADYNKYLHGGLSDLHRPELMKDMEKAAQIVKLYAVSKRHIRIIGDYDADGTTATAILLRGLRSLGAKVDYQIPDRIADGYGLNINIVKKAVDDGVELLLTCDNGIAAQEQVAYARKNGVMVVITDHHEVPYTEENGEKRYLLPEADVLVDPKQPECNYPFPGICGAMIALKLMQTIMGSISEEFAALASVGTICDVMELRDENRYLVKEGLKLMHKNIGLSALAAVNGVDIHNVSAYHIGFVLGPCINASGRLDTAEKAVELLCTEDKHVAEQLAAELKDFNEERKTMTEAGIADAMDYIEKNGMAKDKVLVVPISCHESIAGIIAGRIREQYHRPTIILTETRNGCKGSGRSVEAYDMFAELTRCKSLMDKFGGHKQAAGLSLQKENIAPLREKLNQNCTLQKEDFEEKLLIDIPMPMSYVTEGLVKQLSLLEPFGNGNKKPLFAQKDLMLQMGSKIGKNKNVGKYTISDGKRHYTALKFSGMDEMDELLIEKYGTEKVTDLYSVGDNLGVAVAYYPDINEFRGEKSIQYIIQDCC